MLSTFSRSVPSKVYEAWVFLSRFLVSCIILHLTGWNLIPHFLAQEPNRSMSFWSFIVSTSFVNCRQFMYLVISLLVLRAGYGIWLYQFLIIAYLFTFFLIFTIANTVISKKSYFRLNIWWDVIYIQREQQGAKNGALGDTRQNRSPIRFYSIYNNSLLSEAKKRIYPFQCLATSFIAKQFAFKEFMRVCIKCLFKIKYECVNLSSIVQDFCPIIYYRSQLSFTTMSFPACCLSDRSLYSSRWAMIFEHTMCSSNLQGTQVKETGR